MWYETLILNVVNMSLTGSLVICVLLLFRVVLKRAPRILAYSLWAVVLFRLLCPVSFSSGISALELLDVPATGKSTIEYVPTDLPSDPFPRVDFLVDIASDRVNQALPQGMEQMRSRPLTRQISVAAAVWGAGAAAMALYGLVTFLRLKPVLDRSYGLRDRIWICPGLPGPIVTGVVMPRIYLPEGLTEEEQEHVLLHEYHHIRRWDPLFRLMAFAALTVHWFNPLVWAAYHLSEQDMEISCDEAVVRRMAQNSRCDYSQTLLRLSARQRRSPGSPLSFCEGDPAGRIRNILKMRMPDRRTWAACVLVGLTLAVSLGTDPVVALNMEAYQPFLGRISLSLPEGYDYLLVDDPYYSEAEPNVVIYRTSSEYPVCDGCLSLRFYGQPEVGAESVLLNNGFQVSYNEERWSYADFTSAELGTISIYAHNTEFWTDEDYRDYRVLLEKVEITGYDRPAYYHLGENRYISLEQEDTGNCFVCTPSGKLAVSLSDLSGEVTVKVYEAFTDRQVAEFHTDRPGRDSYCLFEGLSCVKAYYFQITGSGRGTLTVFDPEWEGLT